MSRTAGAFSNVSITLGNLFRVLGMECPEHATARSIVVSKKWLDFETKPCEMVVVTADELAALRNGTALEIVPIQASPAGGVRPPAPARVGGMEEVPELEDLLAD